MNPIQSFAALVAGGLMASLMVAAAPAAGASSDPVISTPVGGPGRGQARNVAQDPYGVAVGPGGTVYIGDSLGVVRQLTETSAYEGVVAGLGLGGAFSGDGGPAVSAQLFSVTGVAVDHARNVVFADTGFQRVQVVAESAGTFYGQAMTKGDIYTIAGTGQQFFNGDGGPATSTNLSNPGGVAIDGAGNVVIADSFHSRIRVVAESTGTFYGQAMTAGDIYTIAGDRITGYSGDGGPATSAELDNPERVSFDRSGNLVIADTYNQRVRVVAGSTGMFYGQAMTAGDIYTIAGNGTEGFSGDGGPATSAALSQPNAAAVDRSGNLVIADTFNDRVRVVAESAGTFYGQAMTAGDIYTVAGNGSRGASGNGGPPAAAELESPQAVAFDTSGNLLIADGSEVRAVAESRGTFYGQAMIAGDIYRIAGNNVGAGNGVGFSGNGGKAINAELVAPGGVAVSAAGDYLVSDELEIRIVPAVSGTYFGHAMTAGDIYAVAGSARAGYSGDGGPATAATLHRYPRGVALDGSGNLIIADTRNQRVRVVAAASGTFYGRAMTTGDIYTVAGDGTKGSSGDGGPAVSAELNEPSYVAVDHHGNLIISDKGGNRIQVVAESAGTFYGRAMTAGDIYTVAGTGTSGFAGDGGPATSAEMRGPNGVTVDGSGNLVFADSRNHRVRVVAGATGTFYGHAMMAGDIYTIAGTRQNGFSGDGGPATAAKLSFPLGIAIDSAGNVAIADSASNRVRLVAESAGTFYGQAMTAGDIYTVAGNGTYGNVGDGGPPTAAELTEPDAVGFDGSGNLIIVDEATGRLRLVTG